MAIGDNKPPCGFGLLNISLKDNFPNQYASKARKSEPNTDARLSEASFTIKAISSIKIKEIKLVTQPTKTSVNLPADS
jgi:hypothetical protein